MQLEPFVVCDVRIWYTAVGKGSLVYRLWSELEMLLYRTRGKLPVALVMGLVFSPFENKYIM